MAVSEAVKGGSGSQFYGVSVQVSAFKSSAMDNAIWHKYRRFRCQPKEVSRFRVSGVREYKTKIGKQRKYALEAVSE